MGSIATSNSISKSLDIENKPESYFQTRYVMNDDLRIRLHDMLYNQFELSIYQHMVYYE